MGTMTDESGNGADEVRRWDAGHIARAGLVIIGLWALANALWIARNIFFLAFLAALMGLLLSVLSGPLRRWGLARGPAVAITALGTLAVLAGASALLWPAIQADLPEFRSALLSAFESAFSWLNAQYTDLTGRSLGGGDGGSLGVNMQSLASGAWPVLSSAIGASSALVIAFFAGIYFAVSPAVYTGALVRLAPAAARHRLKSALEDAGDSLRAWLLATLVNMLVVGVLTTTGLLLLGVPAALPIGVLAGLAEVVPYFGSIGAGIIAIAAAFVESPTRAFWVFVLVLGLQQLQGNVIGPLVLKRVVRLPPALTVLVQSLMVTLFGVFGLLLAVPALAAMIVLVRELYLPLVDG